MNLSKTGFALTVFFFVIFLAFTVLAVTFDVAETETGTVGFYSLNIGVRDTLGTSETWYKITTVLGLVAVAEAGGFAVAGLVSLIKKKSLFKVEGVFFALAATYMLAVVFYAVFELFPLNYRPFSFSAASAPEASYPSSHSFVAVTVFLSGIIAFGRLVKSRMLTAAFSAVSTLLAAFTAVGRLLSGVHWFTDVIGGLLLGAALVSLCLMIEEILSGKSEAEETAVEKTAVEKTETEEKNG